ncbi:DUF397 domain-containing protein [Saccharothrix sp. BKS2]|uniref:DUF397 domain-containing protein n=1 Tax=Saccharothrix sp. BKS2 TaxID=3064400 RepID=UPI0039E75AB0
MSTSGLCGQGVSAVRPNAGQIDSGAGRLTSWRKSSASTDSACVEVALAPGGALVRQSRNIAGTPLCFSEISWTAFLESLRH